MKLTVSKRVALKKSDTNQIRRSGDIPAILYAHGQSAELITIKGAEFNAILRGIKPGQLSTTIFTLVLGNKEKKAIIKDVQYYPTSYIVSHIDFEELSNDVPVTIKVPIVCTGVADCAGVKLGGFLRQIVRFVPVRCLPKDMPIEFKVDVQDLGIRQSRRLSDIAMSDKVKPLTALNEVIVVVAKR